MKKALPITFLVVTLSFLYSPSAEADVVLTFDQSGIANFSPVDDDYGDRVSSSTDSNGHSYDIIAGNGFGTTPNVVVDYVNDSRALWISGYGDLENVYFAGDFSTEIEILFEADAGFEVGIFGFDLAAFGSTTNIQGAEIRDGNDNVLWSTAGTSIPFQTRESYVTNGLFSESLTLSVDLTGLGAAADNIGIDNIQIGQRVSAVPEPAGASVLLLGVMGFLRKRRRSL